jgi:hypothetical protein
MSFQQYPFKGGVPTGTTAQRPGSPAIGDVFYDGDLGFLLIWDGTKWLPCSAPAAQPTIAVTDVGTNIAYGTVQASVAFTEGNSGGKAAGFTAIQGSTTATNTTSPIVLTITGNPGSYSFTGTAYNGFGTSPQATTVSQTLTSLPQAPTIGTATLSGQDVIITWTLNATGGKNLSAITITPYLNGTTAQTSANAATTSATSYTFTGLTQGSAYTFKVKTTNANGNSLESAATNSVTIPVSYSNIEYLVVGGGGGGGSNGNTTGGGGGGAGGYLTSTSLTLFGSNSYTVTVGAGGTGRQQSTGSPSSGNKGGNSSISGSGITTITAIGGGGGLSNQSGGTLADANGGSGGGDNYANTAGTGTAGQGNNGGEADTSGTNGFISGGGGSFAEVGYSNTAGGHGGTSTTNSITGTALTWAAGGGAGCRSSGTAGNGGGGIGGNGRAGGGAGFNATAGNNGSGGGGGGGDGDNPQYIGGTGSNGVVIIAYSNSYPALTISGGLTYTQPSRSGYRVYQFTAGTGTVSF